MVGRTQGKNYGSTFQLAMYAMESKKCLTMKTNSEVAGNRDPQIFHNTRTESQLEWEN